jgi:transcriptional regulator GlxA family with amidase domain
LTVDDIVAATDVSRRHLDRLFAAELGRTVAEELGRIRVEHARQLLSETARTVDDIATRSGFSGRDHLRQALSRTTGLSPRSYRQSIGGISGSPPSGA